MESGSFRGWYLLHLLGLPAILGSFGKNGLGAMCGEAGLSTDDHAERPKLGLVWQGVFRLQDALERRRPEAPEP